MRERDGGRQGGRKGGREGEREGGREGGREGEERRGERDGGGGWWLDGVGGNVREMSMTCRALRMSLCVPVLKTGVRAPQQTEHE